MIVINQWVYPFQALIVNHCISLWNSVLVKSLLLPNAQYSTVLCYYIGRQKPWSCIYIWTHCVIVILVGTNVGVFIKNTCSRTIHGKKSNTCSRIIHGFMDFKMTYTCTLLQPIVCWYLNLWFNDIISWKWRGNIRAYSSHKVTCNLQQALVKW